jgi:hypothetical protein
MADVYERMPNNPFLLRYITPKSEKSRAADPDPVADPGFDYQKCKKFTAEKNYIIYINNCIYLSLGLHKGRPSYTRSIQSSKENIQHFKT